jgi:imidazolonepropionase
MKELKHLDNAWLHIQDHVIKDYGSMHHFNIANFNATETIDANGKYVFPCWCDSHTHLVFARWREKEFVDRIHGMTYEEIAQRGGGILNSAIKLQSETESHLYISALDRMQEITRYGTGAVEIKSGYGLTVDDELKMLRVIKKLKANSPITIKATFLGAHAIPLQYKDKRSDYIKLITDEMLPRIAEEKLADYCDVFCDRGFFTPGETEIILNAGWKYGLAPKIHANELDFSGGIQAGVKCKALSVDHLECTGDEEIEALKNSSAMPTLLPSTAFFLKLKYAPARKMIDAGLPVALATDYNPGSSPSGRMAFVISLACINMGMTPEEAVNAATINSAYAMGVEKELGTITKGKKANVFITKPVSSLEYLPYAFGTDWIEKVIINGKVIPEMKN